jgi:copper chaperone
MKTFSIPDMSCGHCKASVDAAILKLDPSASVTVNLENRTAQVVSGEPSRALINALVAVGFPATEA